MQSVECRNYLVDWRLLSFASDIIKLYKGGHFSLAPIRFVDITYARESGYSIH